MKIKQRVALFLINSFLCAALLLITYFFMDSWGTLVKVACYGIACIGFIVGLVTFLIEKDAFLKTAFIVMICAAVIVGAIAIMSEIAHLENYENDEARAAALAGYIRGLGAWGMLVYFLIQVLQVVILPLPALVCYVPGVAVYGPFVATLLASAGVIVGSLCCYAIGKFFGHRAVVWIAGKETVEKYTSFLSKRGKVLFALMQVLPFFPDDILCMLAGLTCMNFPFFICVIVIVRPVIIALYCYLGSGQLIPFDQPWGIAVWVVIFVVCIVLAILSFRFQDKIEGWFVSKFSIKRKKKTNKSAQVAEEKAIEMQHSETDKISKE